MRRAIFRLSKIVSTIGLSLLLVVGSAVRGQSTEKAVSVKTRMKIVLPDDDAELSIEGIPARQSRIGKIRNFETPPLDQGKEYEYKFTAVWKPNNYTTITRNKTIVFKAGEPFTVDLSVEDPNDKAVIRFVPTPDDVISQMIKLAGVGKEDVVFEPGCGQAAITIAAVKAGAKKGVGIDLDPDRVTESKAAVKVADLASKVEIRLGDALEIKDLSDASVVFLYMGDEFNLLMRPHLWKQLKIGSRIVSHRFTMGDWKPEKTLKIKGTDGEDYEIHLWIITKEVKERVKEEAKVETKEKPETKEPKETPEK